MRSWVMRWYEVREPGMRKNPNVKSYADSPEEAAQAVINLMHNPRVTRVDFVSAEYQGDPEPSIKARALEWTRAEHSKGELWKGSLDGNVVAEVFVPGYDASPYYSLRLGPMSPEYKDVKDVESGKRAAQRALNKFVQMLVGE